MKDKLKNLKTTKHYYKKILKIPTCFLKDTCAEECIPSIKKEYGCLNCAKETIKQCKKIIKYLKKNNKKLPKLPKLPKEIDIYKPFPGIPDIYYKD